MSNGYRIVCIVLGFFLQFYTNRVVTIFTLFATKKNVFYLNVCKRLIFRIKIHLKINKDILCKKLWSLTRNSQWNAANQLLLNNWNWDVEINVDIYAQQKCTLYIEHYFKSSELKCLRETIGGDASDKNYKL